MSRYYYDLHLHSCLSPCGDNDSTPNSIAGMATLCGLNLIALTDHNTAKNCPAFLEAAKRYGVVGIPGMELTTAEDIHVVCLFPTLEDALAFDQAVDARRIKIKNRKDIFGEQLLVDSEDGLLGEEDFLLPNATTVSLDEVPALVETYHGVCYPAHIDRPANGVLEVLGAFPQTPYFPCYELHDENSRQEMEERFPLLKAKRCVISSDAHYLTDMRDKSAYFDIDDEPYSGALVRQRLIALLKGEA